MSARIKLSYSEDGELTEVYKLLAPLVVKVTPKPPKGKYKRAYITLKTLPENADRLTERK